MREIEGGELSAPYDRVVGADAKELKAMEQILISRNPILILYSGRGGDERMTSMIHYHQVKVIIIATSGTCVAIQRPCLYLALKI